MLAKVIFVFLVFLVLIVSNPINGVPHGENADEPRKTQVPRTTADRSRVWPSIRIGNAASSSSSSLHPTTGHFNQSQLLQHLMQRALLPQHHIGTQLPQQEIPLSPGQFTIKNFEPIVDFFYDMPKRVLANVNAMTKHPLGTVEKRKAFHLERFSKHIYDGKPNQQFHIGTLENANLGDRVLYENGRDHFYKLSQEQISDYLSFFDTYNDFDVPLFQKLELVTFTVQRTDLSMINIAAKELLRDLIRNVFELCKEWPKIENAHILCVLAHLFTFSVEFHSQTSTFMPFKEQLFDGMKDMTPALMDGLISFHVTRRFPNYPFGLFLSWLKMTARASWMEESALAILGTQFAQSKPFGIAIDTNLCAGANLRNHFKHIRQSYTNLAKRFILYQKVVLEFVENV